MSEPTSTPPSPAAAAETFDPQRRRLCADDNCVGIVGPDGRCRVCGLAHPDGPGDGATFSAAATLDDDDDDRALVDDAGLAVDDAPLSTGADGGFDAARALCPDGSCVGVLGADGRCKVCGRGPDAATGGTGA